MYVTSLLHEIMRLCTSEHLLRPKGRINETSYKGHSERGQIISTLIIHFIENNFRKEDNLSTNDKMLGSILEIGARTLL